MRSLKRPPPTHPGPTKEQSDAMYAARDWNSPQARAARGESPPTPQDIEAANRADRKPATVALPFKTLPVDVFPDVCRKFIDDATRAIGCDSSYIALPLLSGLAAAIGNARVAQLKPSWTEPATIWTGIIGDSGMMKSPALEAPLRPVYLKNAEQIEEFNELFAGYSQEKERHAAELLEWKKRNKGKADEEPPAEPWKPTCVRYWCEDTTTEALIDRLKDSPRGLLLSRDELSGWLAGLDQYKSGKGADAAHYLKMHGARDVIVDRKTGDKQTTCVRRAAVSITGGIQPGILKELIGREHFENGLLARFILTNPPRIAKRWTDAYINPELQERLGDLYAKLWALDAPVDAMGHIQPVAVPLSPAAKRLFVEFFNKHADEQAELTGDLSAAWSKLEAYCPRFALVLHCVSAVNGDVAEGSIDEPSMANAIRLVEWCSHETRRVYSTLGQTTEERDTSRLVELIERRGGSITARELSQADRRFRGKVEEAEMVLRELERQGFGKNLPPTTGPNGGRPKCVFQLSTVSTVYETPRT